SAKQPRLYDEHHLDLLVSIATLVATAIQNVQLFEETQKNGYEVEILNEMARALSSSLNRNEIVDYIYQYTTRLVDTSSFFIALYDVEEDTVSFPILLEMGQKVNTPSRKSGNGLTEYILHRGESLLIEENSKDKLSALGVDVIGSVSKCWLGVPMMRGNHPIGVIAIESYTDSHAYDFRTRGLLISIASQAAIALENARLFAESTRRNNELGALNEIISSAATTLNLKEILTTVLQKVIPTVGFDGGLIAMYNPSRKKLEGIVRIGLPGEMPADLSEGMEKSLHAMVFESRDVLAIEDFRLGAPVDVGNEIHEGFHAYLGVPLEASGQTLGTLCGFRRAPGPWEQNAIPLLRTIGRQIGFTIENANLFQQTQLRAEETAAINDLGRALSSRLDLDRVLNEVYRGVSRLLDTTNFYIALHDADKKENVFALNVTESTLDKSIIRLPADRGITGYIVRTREQVLITDGADKWMQARGMVTVGEPAKSWMGLPLLAGDQVLGVMAVQDYREFEVYDEHDLYIFSAIANQASIAIQNARLFETEQHRRQIADSLSQMARSVSSVLDLEPITEILLDEIGKLITYTSASVQMIREGKRSVIRGRGINLKATSEEGATILWSPVAEDKIVSGIVKSRQPVVIPDTHKDRRWAINKDTERVRSWIAAPLVAGDEVVGILTIDSEQPNAYDHETANLVSAFAAQAGVAIQNARLFQDVEQRSNELSLINRVVTTVALSLNPEEALRVAISEISDSIPSVGRAGATLLSKDHTELVVVAEYSKQKTKSALGLRIPLKDNPSSTLVIETKKPYGIENARTDKGLSAALRKEFKSLGIYSTIIFPLVAGNDVVGTIGLDIIEEGKSLSPEQIRLAETIITQVSNAIQNARLFEQIQASENRFRDVSTISGDYIWETDLTWNYTYVSERVRDVLGYAPEEMIGTSNYLPHDTEQAKHLNQKLIEEIEANGRAVDIENEVVFKDGRHGFMLTSAVPILDASGNRVGYRGVDKDVTERKYTEHIQDALRSISESALSAPDFHTLLHSIHEALQKLMPAKNMYVALYDERTELLTFPYYLDEYDEPMPPQKPGEGLTSYVLRTGRPLLATPEVYKQLEDAGEVKGGGTIGVDWLGVPLRSGDEIVGVIAIQTYSADQRLTERDRDTLNFIANQVAVAIERKRSELELRALFTSMTDVIIEYDKEGRYIRIAPTNPSRLFRPPDFLLGKKITEALPPETHEPFMNAIKTALETGETAKVEYPLEIEEKIYWFDATVSKLSDDQVFWVARDITDRRNFEETLRRQNEYLATSAEIGRLVTSTLDMDTLFSRTVNLIRERFGFYHAAIFTIEETGFNAVLKSATGKAGEEMLNRGHSLQVGSRSIVGTVSSAGNPLIVNDTSADPIHRPNPLLPDTRSEAAIPLRIGRRIVGVIDIQSTQTDAFTEDDINVLQTLADQIAVAIDNARSYELAQQAITEMRELDQLKSQFLANMSHELRTPLNSIIGFSRVILKGIDGPVTELQEQDLNAIYNSGQHLLRLINDILDLSKIDAGKMELAFDDVNLSELLQGVIPTVGGLIKDKPIKLVQNISPEIPILRADAMRIRQVMINLLSNAAKFTEQGSITISANVEIGTNNQPEVVVKVTDTGPGIAPEDQGKLFQPFSQVDSSPTRKTGGTGLGLSISRRLVELHGGRIDVVSEPNQGSTFFFTLPLPKVKENRSKVEGLRGEQIILAVDDDAQVISLYERYLQPQGYQVIAVTDPTLAAERARQLKPFAITLDIMMPGRDGWTVLAELKNDPETRDIPIVVCSILEEEEKGFSLGAADYLVKPILEDDLLNALGRLNKENDIHNVLVIDDDPKDLRLVTKILESGQFHAIQAQGGEAGWARLEKEKPDAVILDLFMPNLNGFSILEKLRSDPNLSDIPVIVITGADLNPEQQKLLTDFGKSLLQKGTLNENELLSLLERALRRIKQD
ncbi:MAG: GAF domain-containing protein, partial [Chloroflexi bacterium]|nr:GAF domain-containing protein [Chloroflexota bacterium]